MSAARYGTPVVPEFGVHLTLNQVGEPNPDRLAYYLQTLEIGAGALTALWLCDHL